MGFEERNSFFEGTLQDWVHGSVLWTGKDMLVQFYQAVYSYHKMGTRATGRCVFYWRAGASVACGEVPLHNCVSNPTRIVIFSGER
jgi:hypothetical protein